MSLEVQCGECSARFTLPDDLYERKVRGRIVTVRCKKCRADISVDGTENGAVIDNTPTEQMPISLPPVAGLWVVSFGDEDDRELTVAQIKKALEGGEINRETLVWNTSLDEWLMLGEASALKDLVPGAEVGGFLGTGVEVGADVDLHAGDEVGPFTGVGAGTMSDRPSDGADPSTGDASAEVKPAAEDQEAKPESAPVDGTPTLPLVMPKASTEGGPPPKPNKLLPGAPAKLRPAWLSDDEPKRPPATEDPDLPEGEEEAPSSGTPDLRTLMSESIAPPRRDPPDKDETVSDEIFAIGGGGIAAALPSIDLASIRPAPPSDPEAATLDEGEAPAKSERSKRRGSSGPKSRKRGAAGPRSQAAAAAAPEAKGDSSTMWIMVAAIGALAAYWFLIRTPEPSSSPPAPTPTTPATVITPPTEPMPTPELDAAHAARVDAEPAPKESTLVEPKESTPTEPKESTPTEPKESTPAEPKESTPAEPKEPKPGPSAKGPEVAMAAPFDANAARAALSSAAGAASGCRKEGDPAGTATVVVTFAPSGRVTSANISGPPFAGTQTGGCIASALRSAKVPAFSGDHVTVSKTVVIQ